jgi:predicted MFS family arabinose efflux permease
MTMMNEFATIVGPPLAGLLITWHGAAVVLAIDAASFAVLAVTYRYAIPATPVDAAPAPATGPRPVLRDRRLLGLLGLTAAFLFLFGPLYVALPIHVREDLHASPAVLSAYFAAFGAGAVCGAVVTGHLKRWPLAPTAAGTIILFGVSLLPVGLGAPTAVVLVSFVVAGASWAPFLAVVMALLQRRAPAELLPRVMAANGSIMTIAVPVGTLAGGLLITAVGAQPTMLICAVATIALGAAALGSQVVQDR